MVGVAMKVTRRGSLSVSERLALSRIGRSANMQNNRNHDEYKGSRDQMSRDNRKRWGWDDGKRKIGGSYLRQARVVRWFTVDLSFQVVLFLRRSIAKVRLVTE